MDKTIKPLNSWGNSFWMRHLRCLGFMKFFLSPFIDFLTDKMHAPELSIFYAGYSIYSLNTQFLGIYKSEAICQPLYPNQINAPEALLMNNSFSKYIHYFYFLCFIGNLKNTPFFITLCCAAYSCYDFIVLFVDVILI